MKKGLTPEDKALWEFIKQDVQPLKKTQKILPSSKPDIKPFAKPIFRKSSPLSPTPSHYELAKTEPRQIKNITLDAKLDLHGYSVSQAEKILNHFIIESQKLGRRWVLIVTGKGLHSSEGIEKGTLKKFTHEWLMQNLHLIISFIEAKSHHGGSGALYVKIRRIKIS
jgi:DNA-nicking Smr family endonuclease